MNNLILYGVYTGINIITDILIWLYPLPIVWKLQVGMSQKIGLAILFILGALYVHPVQESLFCYSFCLGSVSLVSFVPPRFRR